MAIFIGLIMTALGFFLVWKTEWILANFGGVAWAEAHLGTSGGSRLFYKGLGVILIFLGFATMTGVLQPMLLAFLSPLFGGIR